MLVILQEQYDHSEWVPSVQREAMLLVDEEKEERIVKSYVLRAEVVDVMVMVVVVVTLAIEAIVHKMKPVRCRHWQQTNNLARHLFHRFLETVVHADSSSSSVALGCFDVPDDARVP